jgi:hypothetical protein
MTQSSQMLPRRLLFLPWVLASLAWPQTADDYRVSTDHPRLFLQARRLQLLRREKERQSIRWQQFETLMAGKARWPEPGFASALYSQVTGEQARCEEAVNWALGAGSGLRESALVFDWCQRALSDQKSRALAAKIERAMETASGQSGVSGVRDRVLAAIALAGHRPSVPEEQLRLAVEKWWRGEIVPALKNRRDAVRRDDLLALFEILHAVRDNLKVDLRDPVQGFFRDLPAYLLLSYYPAPRAAPENEYHIPAVKGGGAPDLRRAALARAAELCLAAYESNTRESQFLQGWLMHDRFLMRGPFGIAYEFLWANPYQPGLSYFHQPLAFHDRRLGRLFLRSSWDEDATWLGYLEGELQIYQQGALKIVTGQPAFKPVRLGDAAVFLVSGAAAVRVDEPAVRVAFLLGLRPGTTYEIGIEGQKKRTETADPGGILELALPEKAGVEIRLQEAFKRRAQPLVPSQTAP